MAVGNNSSKRAPKEESENIHSFLLKHAREFCDKTSLHGLRYVTERGAHWLQGALWGTFVILGSILCVTLMMLVWNRFSNNSTITAVESMNFPVWKVFFPSVTICDSNKVQRPKIQKIKDILLSNNVSEVEADEFFASLRYLISRSHLRQSFEGIFAILETAGINVESLMLNLVQRCREMLKKCTWMGEDVECWKLFKMIKTDEGFCCSFNYHHSHESFDRLNESYAPEYRDKFYFTAGAGIHTGLSVVVEVNTGDHVSSTRLVPSVIVLVHDPLDYPEVRTLGKVVQRGELVHIPVEPSIIDTAEDVKTFHPKKRNCVFDDEATLSIGAYGYKNCIIECRLDSIVSLCGCVPFFYNVKNYKSWLHTLQSSEESSINISSFGLDCTCLPTCDVTWYTYTMDKGEMVQTDKLNNITSLHIYFMEFNCLKYKRSKLISWDGLFASFGGIFGLCLGGSILSVVEIVYHFTLRLIMSYFRIGRKNKVNAIRHQVNDSIRYTRRYSKTQKIELSRLPKIKKTKVYPESQNLNRILLNSSDKRY